MREVKVQILMGVHEGDDHLETQLNSLAEQTHRNWDLLASDDSTTTNSRARLGDFARAVSQPVHVLDGPKQGFAANYLHLIRKAEPGWIAFADQDDLWLPDKLERAVGMLKEHPSDQPALYCARIATWDGAERQIPSPALARTPGFRNALIENVAQGNTILLNPAATALAKLGADRVGSVFTHDWWLYLLIAGSGGQILFDQGPPALLYRQHANNVIGAGHGLRAQMMRKIAVLRGAFADRIELNISALIACQELLTTENFAQLQGFAVARKKTLPARLAAFKRLGLYRQRRLGTLGFWGAALFGRV